MKKVMIAIDYHPMAQKVAETGYSFARSVNAEIMIVHAIPEISYYPMEYLPIMGFPGFSKDSAFMCVEDQEEQGFDFLDCVVHHLGNSNVKTRLLNGLGTETIAGYAKIWKADLIIMGAREDADFVKTYAATTYPAVVNDSTIPILIIPADKENMIIKRQQHFRFVSKNMYA
jgi:nucleotide-binding universal stress UspA family protein